MSSTIDISSWDGTITSTDFHIAASFFSEQWNNFHPALPQWSWLNCPKGFVANKVEGYLSLEDMILSRSTENDNPQCVLAGTEDLTCASEDVFMDNAILVVKRGQERHHYDFHVIYSSSFRVPVLYFRAYCSDGEPLAVEDLEMDFPAYTAQELAISKWTFITQEEHPYLNRPWYKLHPCGTSDWMKLLFSADSSVVSQGGVAVEKYLISWFSVVWPIFGKNFSRTQQQNETICLGNLSHYVHGRIYIEYLEDVKISTDPGTLNTVFKHLETSVEDHRPDPLNMAKLSQVMVQCLK